MRRTVLFSNIVYHIYNRGVSKRKLFKRDVDYRYFVFKLFHYQRKYEIEIIRYCLMPNHFHLLLKTSKDPRNISEFMKNLQLSYACYFNRTFNHSGHVFESAYKNKNINSKLYLKKIIEYIENNPVKNGLVKTPAQWEYSG